MALVGITSAVIADTVMTPDELIEPVNAPPLLNAIGPKGLPSLPFQVSGVTVGPEPYYQLTPLAGEP